MIGDTRFVVRWFELDRRGFMEDLRSEFSSEDAAMQSAWEIWLISFSGVSVSRERFVGFDESGIGRWVLQAGTVVINQEGESVVAK